MQEGQQETVRRELSAKPKLSSQRPKEPVNKQEHSMQDRVTFYYRYRIASMARALKKPIYQTLLGSQKNLPKPARESKQSQLEQLDKQVLMKSKYRHRDKINFRRSPLLKLMKYDFEGLRNRMKSKRFEELYDDLDDEETQTKEEKEENKKEFVVDPHFGPEAFNIYRKKNGLAANQLIFAVGNYADLSQALRERGWHENPSPDSLIYDLKFITKCRHIDTVNQLDQQIVNHFEKSNSITTKYGLCRNIKNLIHNNKDPDVYYPRCFDLHDSAEFEDWVEDFKFGKVVAILKAAQDKPSEEHERLLVVCVALARRYGIDLPRKIALLEEGRFPVISHEEWTAICSRRPIELALFSAMAKQLDYKGIAQLPELISAELERIKQYDVQYSLNRENIWIVKPASRSRGRGIKAFSDLDEILEYVVGRDDIQWVAQKYIENPLIVRNRKFDIRQWVVLSDLKPLRVWMYQECYVRFSAEEYAPGDIKNRFAHLTNNSVAKHSEKFESDEIKGYMFFESELAEVIRERTGQDLFANIKKRMRQIVIESLQSVSELIVPRRNTLELFGYDFMIDEDYQPYLIEVNSSPCMEYSTHVTKKLVKGALTDFTGLVCDYMLNKKTLKSPDHYGGWQLIHGK